jgi:hypothetical protein
MQSLSNTHGGTLEARVTKAHRRLWMLCTTYQSIVGNLRYLVNTRLDLAFVVGYVSRFLEKPREDHLAAVKQILRYVADISNWGL